MLEAFVAQSATSNPLNIEPRIRRPSSVSSRSRGRERHITPDDLEKMVMTIKEEKQLAPLELSLAPVALPPVEPREEVVASLERRPSTPEACVQPPAVTDSLKSTQSTTSIVRGFSPAHPSSSYRATRLMAAPSSIPAADLAAEACATTPVAPRKQPRFALGASSGEDSMTEQAPALLDVKAALAKKAPVFSFGGSSNEDESSLPRRVTHQSALSASIASLPRKSSTPRRDEMLTRVIQEEAMLSDDVFETDDEDEIDESAIDEDDSSDWEDSVEESGAASPDTKTLSFQRDNSRPQLTTRRSMITTMLHQSDRAAELAKVASKSTPAIPNLPRTRSRQTSPNGPLVPGSPEEPLTMKKSLRPIAEVPRSSAQPILTTTNTMPQAVPQPALSPRTTRRNMLAHELTVSLRQHLLWERQHPSQFKRRHTAHDLKNLKQYPDKVHLTPGPADEAAHGGKWENYFPGAAGTYHTRGW